MCAQTRATMLECTLGVVRSFAATLMMACYGVARTPAQMVKPSAGNESSS